MKKLAESYGRSIGSGKHKINKDILKTVVQASDWFFEQIASDLGVYADHASRKTLEDTDVVTLMKR